MKTMNNSQTTSHVQQARTRVVTITPAIADQWLQARQYERQRKIQTSHVMYLAEEMAAGNFAPHTHITIVCTPDGDKIVDGQHRLLAVSLSGIPQVFVVTEIPGTIHDADDMYSRLDLNKRRTILDRHAAKQLHELFQITPTNLRVAVAALRYISNGCTYGASKRNVLHPHDEERLLYLYQPFILQYLDFIGAAPSNKHWFDRVSPMALGLLTARFSTPLSKVEDFWRGAAADDKLARYDARKVALTHIMTTRFSGMTRGATSVNYSIRYLAACFNTWMRNEEYSTNTKLPSAKVYNELSPLVVSGVPKNTAKWIE